MADTHKAFTSIPYDPIGAALSGNIRDLASDLMRAIEQSEPSRERSLAITNLEQAVMWANKGISRTGANAKETN